MARISGADRLAELWSKLRIESDQAKRCDLVADALCATARLETAVHEARYTAVKLAMLGDNVPPETIERAKKWASEYDIR